MKKLILFDGNNYMHRMYEMGLSRGISGLRAAVVDLKTKVLDHEGRGIYVWDGMHSRKFRTEIFPEYKGKRPPTSDGFKEQQQMFKRILNNMKVIQVEVAGYEGDDVIGQIAKDAMKDYSIHIESTDNDFAQLGVSYCPRNPFPVPAHEVILYKTLVGDTSDNIPGLPGFGKGKYDDLDKPKALLWMEDDFRIRTAPPMATRFSDWSIANRERLVAMRDICRFRPVSEDLISSNSTFGVEDFDAVEEILKEALA